MAIKTEMLRCFCTVAQTGNLSEAATRLGRTQSAISMTLKQLENHLGQRLFESDRKNRLTPLGEQVFHLARSELRQFDDTIRAIEASANAPQGLIRIASVPSVASLIFPRIITNFMEQHHGTKIELRDTHSQQVIDALTTGQADIGIASSQHHINGVQQIPLFSDQFGLICSPHHPLATRKQPPTLNEITSANFIQNDLCHLIEDPNFQTAIEMSHLSIFNTLSLIAMVKAENWVTVLPQAVIHIAQNDLIFREISGLPDRRYVSLMIAEKTPFRRQVDAFCDMLCKINWNDAIHLAAN
ncbi:LysR family transcriptional regulator [Cochlodiniinecator piscidefendens]|uniref:LysR family transcriptional regulator n=1 Tax=Cochlodiniinecator piscidefendens TaxID=2715756 RepID=UPI00140A0900|nr:LysR family transcriptional regulator [Cochlodiniinecator piscidefendens]